MPISAQMRHMGLSCSVINVMLKNILNCGGCRRATTVISLRLARLDVFEVLVGGDQAGRVELVRGAGAQHVEPVQGGLGANLVLLAGDARVLSVMER